MLEGKIFITGGAGFLGKGIIRRAKREQWPCEFTVYSRDDHKHAALLREFPDVHCIRGDVTEYERLVLALAGHDIVIHAGASKHVDLSENNVIGTIADNVTGSHYVGVAAIVAGVKKVIGISTDKAAHPVNVYGATKFLMERSFQEFNANQESTHFHLARYGNVLDSTGSVYTAWKQMLARQGHIDATDKDMTRFWMTLDQAIDVVLLALGEPSGTVTIPKVPALSMSDFARYTFPHERFEYRGLRPGEKRYEELLTAEEAPFAVDFNSYFQLWPVTGSRKSQLIMPYRSDNPARWLEQGELLEMLGV